MDSSPLALIFTSSVLLIFFLHKIFRQRNQNPSAAAPPPPPGPRKLPIIGNLHQLVGSSQLPPHLLRDLATQYGGVMSLQLGQVPNVVISSAESAKEMMKTHDVVFSDRPFNIAAQILTYDFTDIIFAPHGPYWRQLRKICALELLNQNRVKSFDSTRLEEVSNAVAAVSASAGRKFNFSRMLFSLTSGIVSRAAFGRKYKGHDEFLLVIDELGRLGGGFSLADFFPSLKLLHVLGGTKSQILRLRNEADRMLDGIISDHRNNSRREEAAVDDLVDVLLKVQGNGEFDIPLSDDNIKAVILDIFGAGSDTAATALEWAMSEMVKNPKILQKAQTEVREVFRLKGDVDIALLGELHYLKLVIKETLRLHPPGPFLVRMCNEDCVINGFEIKAKTTVLVNSWAIGRDPKFWEDPEEFRPERFFDNSIDFKGLNFEFLPFGAGRRICPGIDFATATIEITLAKLLYHFDLKPPNGVKAEELDMTEAYGGVMKRKNSLKLIPTPYHKY
ncbi:unnamed protein product [Linum trigynum]|uniref:Cytochrome P450 n=1 Tax=Linum trigynum TaxID=586398 RepID=A0AAV2DT70_9ROSI